MPTDASAAQPPTPTTPWGAMLAPGSIIDRRYRLVRPLGEGGMGAVFEAEHVTIHRRVAVKLIRPEIATEAGIAERFVQEARAANEVRHRNVVEIVDFGVQDGTPYLVMEYLVGETLAARLARQSPIEPVEIVPVLDRVMSALALFHGRGIVHRDIKPANVFLAVDDEGGAPTPKLLDFGIAKHTARDDARLTKTGAMMGTPAYMPPEQVRGDPDVGPAADQYAIAVTLFECLTGRLPHVADSLNRLVIAKATEAPARLEALRPDLPRELTDAVMRALSSDASARFPTIEAFRVAIAPFADATRSPRPSIALATPRTPSPLESAATLASSGVVVTHTVVPPSTASEVSSIRIATGPDRRRGVPWFWAAVVIIAALAASGWALRARTSSRASNASPRVTPAAASASTRVDDGVSLAFDVDPRTAEVFLDDVRAGSGRFAVVRPRDGHRYRVHVVASGFQPIDDVLVASSDVQWSRSLTAVAAPEVITPPPTSAPRASPAGSLSGGRRRPALDHDNPF